MAKTKYFVKKGPKMADFICNFLPKLKIDGTQQRKPLNSWNFFWCLLTYRHSHKPMMGLIWTTFYFLGHPIDPPSKWWFFAYCRNFSLSISQWLLLELKRKLWPPPQKISGKWPVTPVRIGTSPLWMFRHLPLNYCEPLWFIWRVLSYYELHHL